MATFLRSLKFVRRLTLQGRRLGSSPTTHITNTQLLHLSRVQCALLHEDRTYVTKSAFKIQFNSQNKVDSMLNELDQRVRNYQNIYRDHVDQILNAVTENGSLSNMQALLLIRSCGQFLSIESLQVRNSLTDQIWETIKELQVPLDVSHYNALLLVYLENERDFSPVDILMEMKAINIAPNRVTFQRFIEQYCNKGDISGATKILEHMSENEIPINESIFNSLIRGHSKAGDIASATNILDIMKNAKIKASSQTYVEILCAHARRGDIESIKSTLNECTEKSIQISDKEILDVIYTLTINQHEDIVDEVITYLTRGGLYNKDAVACILKLIEKNCTDIAYKLLKTLTKPENVENYESGGFFLRKLITSGANPETIIKYCDLLKNDKLHNSSFELAIIYIFTHGKQHLVLPVMKHWADTGAEIREHYFFPIFVAHSKDNNLQGLLNTVKTMVFDFKITPSISTVKEYIAPFLVEDAFTNAQTLVNNHLPFPNAAHAISLHLLNQSKAQQAYDFITSTNFTYRLDMLTRPLARALMDTKNVKSIAGIIHHQFVMTQKNPNQISEGKLSPREFSSSVVYRAAAELPSYDTKLLTELLKSLHEKGVGIDDKAAEQVKRRLGNNVTAEIETLLNALVSDSLKPTDIERSVNQKNQRYNRNLKEPAEGSPESKMLLMQNYVRNGEREAVEKLLSQLEQENVEYTAGFCATMVDYFSTIENIEEATKWFNKFKQVSSDGTLNKGKLLKYATALVNSNQVDDALQALKYPIKDVDANKSALIEKLLDKVSNVCPERAEDFVDLLHAQKYTNAITTALLSPIVKRPLKAGDVEKAVELYKWACEKYKLAPCKILIMSYLINNEDAKTLKYVTDLSTQVHGEVNSLIDLAVAFFECNRPQQARKILETPGLRLNREKMRMIAEKYYNYDEVRLEGFVELLNGLFMDMDSFYVLLLKSYGRKDKWQECIALWTQMQEDNVQPSLTFMEELERILKQCNQTIPFGTSHKDASTGTNSGFASALLAQNFEQAEKIFNEMPPGNEQRKHRLQLAEAYLSSNNLNKALSNLLIAIDENPLVVETCSNLIQNTIEKLVDSDQFQSITKLFAKLDAVKKDRSKKTRYNVFKMPYNRFLNEYYLKQGKYNEFLSHLEKLLDDSIKINFNSASLFHVNCNSTVLLQHPEFLESFKNVAFKALKHGNLHPLYSLWTYYFIKDDPEAEVIFNDHLKNSKHFYAVSTAYTCQDNDAWNKLPKLTEITVESGMDLPKKRKSLIQIFKNVITSNEPKKYEIAYDCLRHMTKIIPIEQIQEKYIIEMKAHLPDNRTIESLKSESDRLQKEATG